MARTKHHTAAHDDETWKGFFRRWHEGEDSRALSVEAKVCPGTFHLHAARLGMRLKDLPEGHPAKRRSLPYSERPDWWREPNGKLAEGQWRALFALRAQGVPDTVLGPQFGVSTQLICNQARHRGLRREDLRGGGLRLARGAGEPPPPRGGGRGVGGGVWDRARRVERLDRAGGPGLGAGEDRAVERRGELVVGGDETL